MSDGKVINLWEKKNDKVYDLVKEIMENLKPLIVANHSNILDYVSESKDISQLTKKIENASNNFLSNYLKISQNSKEDIINLIGNGYIHSIINNIKVYITCLPEVTDLYEKISGVKGI